LSMWPSPPGRAWCGGSSQGSSGAGTSSPARSRPPTKCRTSPGAAALRGNGSTVSG
jgi:hypothetical protein